MNRNRVLTLLFVSFSILTGCGSKEDAGPMHTVSRMSFQKVPAPAKWQQEASPVSKESGYSLPKQRMIIKTAVINCEINNYDETLSAINKLIEKKNGFIVTSSINSTEESKKSGSITIRIPSSMFDEILEEITKLSSKVLSKSMSGEDITEEFYDVTARLENKKRIELRYRDILKSAKSVKEILQVEEALGNVREEIDRLEGRRRFLSDQTALSTITVNLKEPQALVMVEGEGFWIKMANGFRNGLTGFADVLGFCITICIAAIPIIILLSLLVTFTIWLTRYLKSRKQGGGKKEKK